MAEVLKKLDLPFGQAAYKVKEAVSKRFSVLMLKPIANVIKDTLKGIIKNKVNIETRIYSDT